MNNVRNSTAVECDYKRISNNQWKVILPFIATRIDLLHWSFKDLFVVTELDMQNWKLIKLRSLFTFKCFNDCLQYAKSLAPFLELVQLYCYFGSQLSKINEHKYASEFLELAARQSEEDADMRYERAAQSAYLFDKVKARSLFEESFLAHSKREIYLKNDRRISRALAMWMDCQQKIKVPQRLTLFVRTVAIPILQSHNHPRVCELLSCFDDIDAQILKLFHDHNVDAAKELLSVVKDQDRIARILSAIAAASRI